MDARIVKHPSYSGYTLSPGPAASIKIFIPGEMLPRRI
jgi:hypothetical protein